MPHSPVQPADSGPETATTPIVVLDAAMREEALRYAEALARDAQLADELTQRATVSLWRRGLLQDRPVPLVRAALRTAVRYQFLEHQRQRARQPRTVDTDERWADAVDRAWRHAGLANDLDGGLDALRRCRETLRGNAAAALRLFYDDGLPRAEVARSLGMKETGVKTLLQRLRARLRECVERRLNG
ncbi:MAG: hypothetical protein NXI31_22330 [bacterium]|nr:hypothetical protein [bacterium]